MVSLIMRDVLVWWGCGLPHNEGRLCIVVVWSPPHNEGRPCMVGVWSPLIMRDVLVWWGCGLPS